MSCNVSDEEDHDKETFDDEEDDECFDYDYYNATDFDNDLYECDLKNKDSEYFEYECLLIEDVERLLNESVETICSSIGINPSLAKVLLFTHKWDIDKIKEKYRKDSFQLFTDAKIKSNRSTQAYDTSSHRRASNYTQCNTCLQCCPSERYLTLSCNHNFCKDCWSSHLEVQVTQGVTIGIECMAQGCRVLVPEDFALNILTKTSLREKYQQFAFSDYVKSHPELRYCPGANCCIIIRAKENKSKRVICKHCKSSFCFKCGCDYHAPTNCEIIKRWLTKCADDSETANYISAHTKDCPKCHICIEKNGG
ncbi:protein ariadne-2-like protein, partial [Leptotrombidium deliense]